MKSLNAYLDSAAWICEANLVGTSTICRYLVENGHNIVSNPSDADVIIINSCGLTKMRRELSITYFEKYYARKKAQAKIILYGCLVKIDQQKVRSLDVIPVDFNEGKKLDEIFFNGTKFENVHPYCDPTMKEKLLEGKHLFQSTKILPFILSGMLFPFVKKIRKNYHKMVDSFTYTDKIFCEISQGCIGNCSYCMIKKARGHIHSRRIDDILYDIETLYDPTKNLFLVADDCGSYGIDIKTNLFELLYEINKKFPGIQIDLNYLNPYWLERYPEEYLRLFKDVHIGLASIPVQSGSNRVIQKMNRRYNINAVVDVIHKIKQTSPTTIIYTHFLIGFPGESAIDFLRTLYRTTSFDIPVGLIYSEHEENTCLKEGSKTPAFIAQIRYFVFMSFINLVLLYTLLTYSPKSGSSPPLRVIDKK